MKKIYLIIFILFINACTNFNSSTETWIKNIHDENIYIKVDGLENTKYHRLAILQHGLASNMEHNAIQMAKKAFIDNHYVVISFDSRYSLGKGNNDVEKVKLSTFIEDLKTVANWAKKQPFYNEPFALAGHSLGGASVIEFSAQYPEQIDILIPITPVISGQLWEKSCMANLADFCRQWKHNGSYSYTDEDNHKTAIIPYSVVASCNTYNANILAPSIKAKTLLIAAEKDIIINPNDLQKLSSAFSKATTTVIKSAGHNFNDRQNQTDLYKAITLFLK